MANWTDGNKQAGPKKDRAWFEQKVAELKAELEKLPKDRREQLSRELDEEQDGERFVHSNKKGGEQLRRELEEDRDPKP